MLPILSRICVKLTRPLQNVRYCVSKAPQIETDLDREKKKKIISLEISVARQEGFRAPDLEKLNATQWDRILELPSKSARKRFYEFLWGIEMKQISNKEKKEKRKHEIEQKIELLREEKANNKHIVYGLRNNTMFLRIYDSTMKKFHNRKLFNAMRFGQQLVIDCSYDEHMTPQEAANTAKQLGISFADNRYAANPFDLHFCNFNYDSIAGKALQRLYPTMNNDDFPMNINTESLTEKFDKEQLVYLTPHCKNDLVNYSHDDIYVIGAMVDKFNKEPLSLAKAKKQGLRMARLPLDRYLSWGGGSGKSLTINQMVNIMLEMKKHNDWEKALRFVPRRKLVNDSDEPKEFRKGFTHNYKKRSNNQDSQHTSDTPNSFQERPRHNSSDSHDDNSFQERPRFNSRQSQDNNSFQERPRYNSRQSQDENSFQERPRYNSRQSQKDSSYQGSERKPFDQSRSAKEQKHADRYKFDLESWGSKTKKDSKD